MSGRLWLRSPFESLRMSGKGRVPLREGALHGDGALQRAPGGAERGHEAVAHRLRPGAAVGGEALPDDALMLAEEFAGLGVAEALGEGGGALDVGEEDRAERAEFGWG